LGAESAVTPTSLGEENEMTHTFSYEFSTTRSPEEAQARLQRVLTARLRRPSGGGGARNLHREMRLGKAKANSLTYKPKLVAPLPISTLVWLGRVLSAERVNVTFAPDGSDGGTHITVAGKVGRGSEAIADREFWSEVLTASN
jgi:hypothetical protein